MASICKLCKNLVRANSIGKHSIRNLSTNQSINYKKREQSLPKAEEIQEELKFSTTQLSTDLVVSEKYKAITFITLNRPEHKNSLTKPMIDKLIEAVKNFENDNSSDVAVLSGSDGNFCTGYDLDDLVENLKVNENYFHEIIHAFRIPKKPLVASISGSCISAGLELALACDYRVIEENAIISVAQKNGQIPLIGEGASQLARFVGCGRALDLTLTRRQVPAKEAMDMGLVNVSVSIGTGVGKAYSIASHISHGSKSTMVHNRRLIYEQAQAWVEKASITKDFVNEVLRNIEISQIEKLESYAGAKKRTHVFDVTKLADWEREEYYNEVNRKK